MVTLCNILNTAGVLRSNKISMLYKKRIYDLKVAIMETKSCLKTFKAGLFVSLSMLFLVGNAKVAFSQTVDPNLVSYNVIPLQGTGFKVVVQNQNSHRVQVQFEVVCDYYYNFNQSLGSQHADHYFFAYVGPFSRGFATNACNQGYWSQTTATSFNVTMTEVLP